MNPVVRVVINAVALWVATLVVPGLQISGASGLGDQVLTFALLGLVFGVVNVLVRPVVKFFAFPAYLLTLGLFAFVVNAAMLELTAWISSFTVLSLHVDHFFWSAVLGALVVSAVSWVLSLLVHERRHERV